MSIFISYRTDESQLIVEMIDQHLVMRFSREQVFRDKDSLRAGQEFPPELGKAIADAKVGLVIIGSNWEKARDKRHRLRLRDPNDWVRKEVEQLLSRRIPVIPVFVNRDKSSDADVSQFPTFVGELLRRHGYQVRSDLKTFNEDMKSLVRVIRRCGVKEKRSWLRLMRTIAPFALALVVVFASVWGFRGIREDSKLHALEIQRQLLQIQDAFNKQNNGETDNSKLLAQSQSLAQPKQKPLSSVLLTQADARLMIKCGDDHQQVIGYLMFKDYSKADQLIQHQLAATTKPSHDHQLWLTMHARSRMQQAFVAQAYDIYREAVEVYPEDWMLRVEWINALLKPALHGIEGPSGNGRQEWSERQGGFRPYEETIPLAEQQLQLLMSLGNPPEELINAKPFLCYRLGQCKNLLLRFSKEPERRREAIEIFEEASRLFREQGEMMIAAESLHHAAASDLLAANLLKDDLENQSELCILLDDALEHLALAEEILGGREQLAKSVPGYFVAKRMAHALIRHPRGQPQRLHAAKLYLAFAKQSPGAVADMYAIIHLETWLYQRLSEYENRMGNLTLAVKSWKQKNDHHYFNRRGEECWRDDTGKEVVVDSAFEDGKKIVMSLAPMDMAEPVIRFTFFKDWIREGGSYEDYLRFPVK